LEDGGRVSESKKHHQRFKVAMIHTKCYLLFITFLHVHVVVILLYIELHEVLHISKLVDWLQNKGKRVSILDHQGIQGSIVLNEA
jgi:hypothetical protein